MDVRRTDAAQSAPAPTARSAAGVSRAEATPAVAADTLGLGKRPAGAPAPASPATEAQQEVIRLWAAKPMPEWVAWWADPSKGGKQDPSGPAKSEVANVANAKLTLGVDTARVNQVLQSARPYSDPGTHFTGPFGLMRKGDYDFALTGLTTVLYQHWNNPALTPETRKHLATVVLNQEGNDHMKERWLGGIVPETENHILMTESARYLKNQLVATHGLDYANRKLAPAAYDNEKNGFNDWFVNHLSTFTRTDFDEYNSRPYQRCSMKPIQNLYEFAADPEVKLAAQITLDYMAAKFALQSNEFRRVAPFRRRKEYNGADHVIEKDSEAARYAMLAADQRGVKDAWVQQAGLGGHDILQAATLSYKPPAAVMDLMVNKGHNPSFSRSRHRNTEIHYAEENFSIAAGGHYARFDRMPELYGRLIDVENANVMPTTIWLKDGGPKLSDAIRFLGRGDNDRHNNTGVYENFASGIRPQVPQAMLSRARAEGRLIEKGDWQFLAVGQVYVAMHTGRDPSSPAGYAETVGFCEVVDQKEFPSLQAFQAKVEQLNAGKRFQHYGPNTYTTTRGKSVDFVMADPPARSGLGRLLPEPAAGFLARTLPGAFGRFFAPRAPKPDRIEEWAIRGVADKGRPLPIETDLTRWPLVDTALATPDTDGYDNDWPMRADGTGQVLINNPHQQQSLLMSTADQKQLIRLEQNGPVVNLAENAALTRQAGPNQLELTVALTESSKTGYLSLKWPQGARPEAVQVHVKRNGQWTLAEDRRDVFKSDAHAFRTDFDVTGQGAVEAVRFVVTGGNLALSGRPEVYKAY